MRLALSTDKVGVKRLSEKGQLMEGPADAIKDPYILEFLHLKEHFSYSKSDLENALIDKLEHFLLELGKGFTFVAIKKESLSPISISMLIWFFTTGPYLITMFLFLSY
jgi:predicted nuclease of restriction endonuclease-like (RecB) superfamily